MLRIDHIGIAVRSIDDALKFFKVIGADIGTRERIESQSIDITTVKMGDMTIELLEPFKEGAVQRFIEKRGEGIHHICIGVDDINVMIKRLQEDGFKMVDDKPKRGVEGLIAFIHPSSTNGVLFELKEG